MPVISNEPIMTELTATAITFAICSGTTFWSAREIWSARRAGSLKTKVGLVHRKIDPKTFQGMLRMAVAFFALSAIALFASVFGLLQEFAVTNGTVGVITYCLVLGAATGLGSRFSRR